MTCPDLIFIEAFEELSAFSPQVGVQAITGNPFRTRGTAFLHEADPELFAHTMLLVRTDKAGNSSQKSRTAENEAFVEKLLAPHMCLSRQQLRRRDTPCTSAPCQNHV